LTSAARDAPGPSPERIAALDLGSNSFHLLVADVGEDGTITPVLRQKEMLRLGSTVAATGSVGQRVDDVLASLRRLTGLIESTGATQTVACATAALRDADDGDAVLARIATELGLDVRVISGLEEAALIFEAVRASVVLNPSPALCLDLGGGSLEITIGTVDGLLWSVSLPLGVARLTAQAVEQDPPSKRDVKRVRAAVASELDPVLDQITALEPKMLVGTSGTLSDLAAIAVHQRTGVLPASLNQVVVTREELEDVHALLSAMTVTERQEVPGLEPRRAEVVVAGSTLLLTAMEAFGLDTLTIGEWALREGMLLQAADQFAPAHAHEIRRASVLHVCRRYGWPEAHSRHVAQLAVSLFDQTAPLHGLDAWARDMLEHAALLHDIGAHVSAEGHDLHTAYLIEHGRLRGFDPGEVAMLACLGRYHRRGRPSTEFEPYALLRPERRLVVDMLAAVLRLAHGLDHGRSGAVNAVEVDLSGDEVVLTVVGPDTGLELELWGAERSGKRFQQTFARPLVFRVPASADAAGRS
jgi:exopolyphosphatase/guanosine-5'-triphosphate,3'-diphosphate pyrophosphatase